MKRPIVAVLSAALVISCFAGCRGAELLVEPTVEPAVVAVPDDVYQTREKWEGAEAERVKNKPVFRFIEGDPALPDVLLIGDSISIGYTDDVREALAGKADVYRIPDNAGYTAKGLENIELWLGDRKWRVIHFNWGLHDLKFMKDRKLDLSGEQIATPEEYAANLEQLVIRLNQTGARLIWCSTTPVPEGSGGRRKGDAATFNAAAAKVMQKHGVPIDDLYAHALPRLTEIQLPKNVHFTPEGSTFLGQKVAAEIMKALKTN